METRTKNTELSNRILNLDSTFLLELHLVDVLVVLLVVEVEFSFSRDLYLNIERG